MAHHTPLRALVPVLGSLLAVGACGKDTTSNQQGSKDAGPGVGGGAGAIGSGGASGSAGSGSGGRVASTGGGGSGTGGIPGTGGGSGVDAAPPPLCDDKCHFVRAGATGSGHGSDWTNAWTALPDSLQRGHTYYVADGDYAAYTFDDAASGATLVTVLKATATRHGSDTGWQAAYGDGSAVFGPIDLKSPYTVVDGQSPRGFVVAAAFQGNVASISADYVTLANAELDGKFAADAGGQHVGGACTGLDVGGNQHVTVKGLEIHDVADDGVSVSGASYFTFTENTVHALHACGTDGGCGPCYNGHSDGIEAYHVVHGEFTKNFVYDVRSTATFFFGNWADSLGAGPSDYCQDIVIANNLFYAPEVGLVAYIQDVVGVNVFHNVFWGVHQGGYGGLSVGLHVTNLQLYDNVILSINLAHVGATFDAAQHHGDYNLFGVSLGQWTNGAHDVVAADPGFSGISGLDGPAVTNPTVADFALKVGSACIDKGWVGDATVAIPSTDFYGLARDAKPDLGAIEKR